MIKGIQVVLFEKTKTGMNEFDEPVYQEKRKVIDDVLVMPSSTDDMITSQNLTGKKAMYTLAIPKGDENKWEDNIVEFFGQRWHVLGFSIEGIEKNIPLRWNKKVMVEKYE